MSAVREPRQPAEQKLVEGRLADPDRGVGVDGRKAKLVGHLFRQAGDHVFQTGVLCIETSELQCPLIYIHGPDAGLWRPRGEGEGDRAVSAAEVQQFAHSWRRRGLSQEDLGTGVHSLGGKDA